MELWSVLAVIADREFGRGVVGALKVIADTGDDELWEGQFALYSVFLIVTVRVALQSADGLECHASREREDFAAMKDVTVFIYHRQCRAEITCGIGAFRLKLYGMFLARCELNDSVKGGAVLDDG